MRVCQRAAVRPKVPTLGEAGGPGCRHLFLAGQWALVSMAGAQCPLKGRTRSAPFTPR